MGGGFSGEKIEDEISGRNLKAIKMSRYAIVVVEYEIIQDFVSEASEEDETATVLPRFNADFDRIKFSSDLTLRRHSDPTVDENDIPGVA